MELSQVSKKYEALLISAKSVIRKLETNYQEHHQHAALIKDCSSKIKIVKEKSENIAAEGTSLNEYEAKLEQIQEIQKLVEKSQRKLTYILDLKERVIPNTHVSGILQVENATAEIKAEIDSVMTKFLETKNEVTKNYHKLKDFNNQCDLMQGWMKNVSCSLVNNNTPINSLAERNIFIENLRSHQREFEDWESMIKKLEECQFVRIPDSSIDANSFLLDTVNKYNSLKETLVSTIERENDYALKHEEYNTRVEAANEWLDENSITLKSLSSAAAIKDEDILALKDNMIPDFLRNLKENASVLDDMQDSSKKMEGSLSEQAKETVSSCNNETQARYVQIVEDADALQMKITEALEQEMQSDTTSLDTENLSNNEIYEESNIESQVDNIDDIECTQEDQTCQQNQFSMSTSTTRIVSTSATTEYKEMVTTKINTSAKSYKSSVTTFTRDEALQEDAFNEHNIIKDSIDKVAEIEDHASKTEEEQKLIFDAKMSELQKWLLNRRNYNMKLNQINDVKTLEDAMVDIEATLARGKEVFKDLTVAYENISSEAPGIIDEKYDRLEGEFSGFTRDMSSTVSTAKEILPKCLSMQSNSLKGAKFLQESFALEKQSSRNKEDIESYLNMLKTSSNELNDICKELESSELDSIETEEHFITTVIEFVSIPAYGILSQCQLRCRRLTELIDEYEKELQSIDSTKAIETDEENNENSISQTGEDISEDIENEDIEDGDKSLENDYDEITSQDLPDLHRSEVRFD